MRHIKPGFRFDVFRVDPNFGGGTLDGAQKLAYHIVRTENHQNRQYLKKLQKPRVLKSVKKGNNLKKPSRFRILMNPKAKPPIFGTRRMKKKNKETGEVTEHVYLIRYR